MTYNLFRECLANVPEDISNEIGKKFDIIESATCRTCKHRQRYQLNPYSKKVIQCCDIQLSRRSNSGYKTIRVTDKACFSYENVHNTRTCNFRQ